MARPSKLTEKQWAEIERRLLAGDKPASLAKEFGIDRAAITRRFSQQVRNVKEVANQIVSTDMALRALPVAQQLAAINLADELKAISTHMAGAAKYGAMTAHRLSGIANAQVDLIDDAEPLKSIETLKGIAALTKTANEASDIALNLLNANKKHVERLNEPTEEKAAKSLSDFYGELASEP